MVLDFILNKIDKTQRNKPSDFAGDLSSVCGEPLKPFAVKLATMSSAFSQAT